MKGGIVMKNKHYFTKSTTFDIDYLFDVQSKNKSKKNQSTNKFANENYDVKNLSEK